MCLPFAHMHSLCSGENILIAASIEVLVVLLHSIAPARRKVLYMLSIAHQIIPTCGKVKLRNSYMLFNCYIPNWRLFSFRGSFLLCIRTELSELVVRYFDSIQIGGNITFPCSVRRAQMRNVFTERSDLVKKILDTRHLEMRLKARSSSFCQGLETFRTSITI